MMADSNSAENWANQIHEGDAHETLAQMPESSVHMCMTSPPYYALRDYGEDGQIGLENTLGEYIQNLVDVGEELRRVLRNDGSWWLNLGDTYIDKQKQLVPHKVAVALQDSGWIIRNDVTWYKPNPMPENVKDRLSTTTEQIFHLTLEPNYWYDLDAIREPHKSDRTYRGGSMEKHGDPRSRELDSGTKFGSPAGKNPGDVFEVTTKPYPDAHFAVYPPELCEKPIKATCPPEICAGCGVAISVGCSCATNKAKPGIVLDPFVGSGTTCKVAKQLGRRFVGIDLNPEYVAKAQKRVGVDVDNPELLLGDGETSLGAYTDGGSSE